LWDTVLVHSQAELEMLSQRDINTFKELEKEALRLLPENNVLPVVDQRLYLNKDGSWDARFMMSGYSLGKLSLRDLLKQYVVAVSGVEPTAFQMVNYEAEVLDRLIESLRQSVASLKASY